MARKRMIDPKIWDSCYDKNLSSNDFTVLIAAISSADDEGRGKISMIERSVGKMLKEKALQKSLKVLSDTIVIYDKLYYYIPNWHTYQKLNRPTPSKLPSPVNGKSLHTHELINEDSVSSHELINEGSSKQVPQLELEEELEVEVEVEKESNYTVMPPPQQQVSKLFAIWGRIPDNGERAKVENLLKQFNYNPVWKAFHRASEMGKDKKNVAYVRGILTNPDKSVSKFSKGIGAG